MRVELVEAVLRVQALPYAWPAPPTADAVREMGAGTCAGKHALLAEDLRALRFGVSHVMVVGPLASSLWPDLVEGAEGLLEVHQCLSVETDWAGPLLVDVTWHPDAVRAGLPGSLDWDGEADMVCAVQPLRRTPWRSSISGSRRNSCAPACTA